MQLQIKIGFTVALIFIISMPLTGLMNVNADNGINVDFTWYPSYPRSYQTIYFHDNSTDDYGHIINWTWNFGDGSIGYGKNPTHFYTHAGKYNITLYVIDNRSIPSYKTQTIIIENIPPMAKFFWTKQNNAIFFTSLSHDKDGYITNYTWNFGDGSIGYGRNVSHSYPHEGTYNVTLNVTDDWGDFNITYRNIDTTNEIPYANFDYSPSMPTDLDVVKFNSTSYDKDGYIVNYTWNFGDGSIGYGRNVSHEYADNGIYQVTLTVYDNEDAFNKITKEIEIYNICPVADFIYSPQYPIPNKNISFNSTSYDKDGYIVNYTWNFGDGSIGYGRNVSHIYTSAGIYNVSLSVTDDDNCRTIHDITLVVADFYVNKLIYDPANHIWRHIQDALDNATDGAFIYVLHGVYHEDVHVNKSVHLLGENATIVGSQFDFYLLKDGVLIENFVINGKNGFMILSNNTIVKKCQFNVGKAGIKVYGRYNKILENSVSGNISIIINSLWNTIENNSIYGKKCGIIVNSSHNTIYKNYIEGIKGICIEKSRNNVLSNIISSCNYGLYMNDTAQVGGNLFKNNENGIFSENHIDILGNTFVNNSIGINTTSLDIFSSIFIGNNLSFYAGIANISGCNIKNSNGIATTLSISNSFIENGSMEATNAHILDTIIKNCSTGIVSHNASIKNVSFINNKIGIKADGNISNCSFIRNGYSIIANKLVLINSSFDGNEYGIFANDDNKISNNSFFNNEYAVFINGSKNEIVRNEIYDNTYGIKIDYSKDNIMNENLIYGNTYGAQNSFSLNSTFIWNIFNNNTYNIDIEGNDGKYFYNFMNESNKINGLPAIYKINEENVTIDGSYGYVGVVACKNVSIFSQNVGNNGQGILIVNSSNIALIDSKFYDNLNGIYILESHNVSLSNNSIFSNIYGISIISSHNNFVNGCKVFNNTEIGIKIFDIGNKYEDNTLNCYLYNNTLGIRIQNSGGNNIYGNVDSLKIENSNNNNLEGIFYDITIRDSSMEAENSSIYNGHITKSNVNMNKCKIFSMNADYSSFNTQNSLFYNTTKIYNSNIFLNRNDFNNSNAILSNCSLMIIMNTFHNDTHIEINNSDGNISECRFFENGNALKMNSLNVTTWNSTFNNNTKALLLVKGIVIGGKIYNNTYGCIGYNASISGVLFHHNVNALILNYSNATVEKCSFWKNFYGIIANGNGNKIYHNNFVYNIKNAIDNSANIWNLSSPKEGNYWDDYYGNDANGDGIGDIPYTIGSSKDYYPLMNFYNNTAKIPNVPPTAAFSFYPLHPFSFEKVIFVDASDDANGLMDIVSWLWNFGDGATSNKKNPSHNYSKPGRYNVTLTVKDRAGNNNTTKLKINVSDLPPITDFSYSPKNVSSYTIIFFTSLSHDKDGYIVNYTWNFGDGSIGYGRNASHKYSKPGRYIVKLTTKDDFNVSNSSIKEITIENKKPSVDFDLHPEKAKVGEKISFKDLSTDIDGYIVSWHWDFGDGTASNQQNPNHSYSKQGTYTVKLTVKDNYGGTSTFEKTIEIKARETPGMEVLILLVAFAFIVAIKKKDKI